MAVGRAILAYLQGVQTGRRRAVGRLHGTPFMMRLIYLGGHPGIWASEPFWVGLVGDRLRFVADRGQRWYDLHLSRLRGVSSDGAGRLLIRYEPTAGLVTTLEFHTDGEAGKACQRLIQLVAVGA